MSAPPLSAGRFRPPHRVINGWLGEVRAAEFLSYALAAEARFEPSTVNSDSKDLLKPSTRRSSTLHDLGAFTRLLKEKALAVQSDLEEEFGMTHRPTLGTQLELVAHGDGDYFRWHIDTRTGDDFTPGDSRRLSLVYYLHREPRRFHAGRLRLFDLSGKGNVDIDPAHDSLVAFPSFAPHEVEPVSCPGGSFADSRFAVNIWLYG